MRTSHIFRLFAFLILSATLFNSCTKDSFTEPIQEDIPQLTLKEAGLTDADIEFFSFMDSPINEGVDVPIGGDKMAPCEVEICATFTGTGKYGVFLPNGTQIIVNLITQTVTINGVSFPLVGNQLCETITLTGPSTATLGFKGTGSVVVTATYLPGGPSSVVFQAGVGNPNPISVTQDVTLDCPDTDCEVQICATFTGSGKYGVVLPNGTQIIVNLITQTVTINGVSFPLIGNQLCETITLNGPSTALLGFKGTGSVVVEAKWPDGTTCVIFQAGVGNPNPISTSTNVTLSCDPPC